MFKVFLTDTFKRKLSEIASPGREKVSVKIEKQIVPQLKREPHFGTNIRKLRAWSPPTFRYRIGNFRIFYIVDEKEKVVAFVSIDDRKKAYRK